MKINWSVRLKSKKFWLTAVPAALLLAQTVAVPFGYNFDIAKIGTELTAVINAVFALLAVLGVVIDPTTAGVGDSETAMNNEIKSKKQLQIDTLQAQIDELTKSDAGAYDGSTTAINPTEVQ